MSKKIFSFILVLAFCASLSAAQLQLLTPRGSECWQAGKPITITWRYADLKGDVRLVVYKDGEYFANVDKVPVRLGRYVWRVPANMPAAGNYSLRIYQGQVSDRTSREFSIMAGATTAAAAAVAPEDVYVPELPDELVAERFVDELGREGDKIMISGRPPKDFRAPVAAHPSSAVVIGSMPAYNWSFGCTATSAAMASAYYDNKGYPNMYTGPSHGGVMPLTNSSWGDVTISGEVRHQCPLSATRQGLDGRTTRGHVNDYWVKVNHPGPDPFITNGWTEHAYGSCTGDYMKTSQSKYDNKDGSTWIYCWTNGAKYNESNAKDGGYGFRLFVQSRGYTVTEWFNQYIYGYSGNTQGFTFAQFQNEINNNRPLLVHVQGHTMLGYGYDAATNKIYIHDTWDYLNHSMTWGGTYEGMQMYAVTVLKLPAVASYTLTLTAGTGGTTTPAAGTHSYLPGQVVKVWAFPSTYYIFKNWSGSASGSANPLSVTMSANKSIKANFRKILAPSGIAGRKEINRSLSQREVIGVVTWNANSGNSGLSIAKYRVYLAAGGTRTLLAEVDAAAAMEYWHRKAGEGQLQYEVAAMVGSREGAPAKITIN